MYHLLPIVVVAVCSHKFLSENYIKQVSSCDHLSNVHQDGIKFKFIFPVAKCFNPRTPMPWR